MHGGRWADHAFVAEPACVSGSERILAREKQTHVCDAVRSYDTADPMLWLSMWATWQSIKLGFPCCRVLGFIIDAVSLAATLIGVCVPRG